MSNNQQQNEEYISMINYLINNLNKAKINPALIQQTKASMPVFLFEFFVFELYLPRDIIRIVKQPIIACRLLDFPTLTLEGRVNLENETIIFNQGKSSFFEMDLGKLKDSLINQSMYIMLLDLNHGNMKIIGSCRLNISVFAYDSFLNYDRNSKGPDPRRNILQLFDNSTEKIGEFEISLLIRREYYKFDKNVEINENEKTVYVKKLKKKKEKYTKQKNEQIFLKAEEKQKEKYIQKEKEVKQPQYFNNFVFERNDSAFNAHPVNKVVAVRSQSQTHISNQSQPQSGNKKKRKKSKNSIKGIQTDLIPGVDVPINYVDYRRGKSQNKKKIHYNNGGGQNVYLNNIYYNSQQFIQSKYSNGQNYPQYYTPSNNTNSFYYSNNSNNNFYNQNNFNNSNYYQQNINSNNLFHQTNGNYNMDNQTQIYNKQMNNNNLNEKSKSKNEPNEYLRLLSEIKNKVSTYKEKLSNEQINIKKIKEQRNINTNINNINENSNSTNYNNNNNININININNQLNNNNYDNNEEINNDNYDNNDNNIQINKNDSLNKNDNNDINNNIDIKPENVDNTEEEYKSEFIQNITESESNPAKNSSDNFLSNSQNLKKEDKDKEKQNKIENPIKEEEDEKEYDDFESNDNFKKDEEEKKDFDDLNINKEDSTNELKTKEKDKLSSKDKYNNYNIDIINESNNEIEESIKEDNNDIKNKEGIIHVESQSGNGEKNSEMKYNSSENNLHDEIKEEPNTKINSNHNTMIKEARSTSENLASSGKKSFDTNDLEDMLK